MKKNSFFQSFAFAALTLCAATVFALTTVSCSNLSFNLICND